MREYGRETGRRARFQAGLFELIGHFINSAMVRGGGLRLVPSKYGNST